ncbi:MAG: nucleotidyltransferase domain-containing protein [Desulfovibrio sp.]|nr:nucleotidyltransferase domain-containing protein [Desulfovibrio sp.]
MLDKNILQECRDRAHMLCREHGASLLYLTLFGSTLYGTDMPGKSDIDVRGIFLPSQKNAILGELPRSLHWSSGDNVHRNSSGDMDIDLWSVQHWLLKLLPAGDTGATDLLFSPSHAACTLYADTRLKNVFAHPERLYDAKNCRAYADYSLGQAKKYGIKGSRLGALRSVHTWLREQNGLRGQGLRLKDVLDSLLEACGDDRYCAYTETNAQPALQLCGKIHVGAVRLEEFLQRVETDMDRYGARAIAAEHNEGLDFKALSHALRAFDQMEELYATGKIVFPLATRERLKSVKRGDIPWLELEQIIVNRLVETDAAREQARCVCVYDAAFAREQVQACYGLASMCELQTQTDAFENGFSVPIEAAKAVHTRLEELASKYGVKILYAVESGSRGWGFASVDSDFDVRFIYAHEPEWYLGETLARRNDTIAMPVEDTPAGELDICGWDLEKALGLFSHSNASLLEWLSSPLVYVQCGSLADRLRTLLPAEANCFRLWRHYCNMAGSAEQRYLEKPSIKAWLYVLRPLLMALWIENKKAVPPMCFERVLHDVMLTEDVRTAIQEIVDKKRTGLEEMPFTPAQSVQNFVQKTIDRIKALPPTFDVPRSKVDYRQEFRALLREAWPCRP